MNETQLALFLVVSLAFKGWAISPAPKLALIAQQQMKGESDRSPVQQDKWETLLMKNDRVHSILSAFLPHCFRYKLFLEGRPIAKLPQQLYCQVSEL